MAKFNTVEEVKTFRDYVNRRVGYTSTNFSSGNKFNKVADDGNICDNNIDGA